MAPCWPPPATTEPCGYGGSPTAPATARYASQLPSAKLPGTPPAPCSAPPAGPAHTSSPTGRRTATRGITAWRADASSPCPVPSASGCRPLAAPLTGLGARPRLPATPRLGTCGMRPARLSVIVLTSSSTSIVVAYATHYKDRLVRL